jgi:hypothetical protein
MWIYTSKVPYLDVYSNSLSSLFAYPNLGQREFISADGLIDDIKGIAYVPELNEIQGILKSLL